MYLLLKTQRERERARERERESECGKNPKLNEIKIKRKTTKRNETLQIEISVRVAGHSNFYGKLFLVCLQLFIPLFL